MLLCSSRVQWLSANVGQLHQRPVVSRLPVVSSRRTVHVSRAGAGGFGKSTKKKVDTSGGFVVPKEGKRVRLSDLSDEAGPSSKQADGAPPGFPTGPCSISLHQSPAQSR